MSESVDIDEKGFWKKIKRSASKMGDELCIQAISMYLAISDAKTPVASKAILVSAVTYLIVPVDLVPDFIPVLGFTDDASAIAAAMTATSTAVTDEHKETAKNKWK